MHIGSEHSTVHTHLMIVQQVLPAHLELVQLRGRHDAVQPAGPQGAQVCQAARP